MSLLNLSHRPFTVFDPANREHREHYHTFVKYNTWSRCPYRFIVPDQYSDLITMIERSLVQYYNDSEFDHGH